MNGTIFCCFRAIRRIERALHPLFRDIPFVKDAPRMTGKFDL